MAINLGDALNLQANPELKGQMFEAGQGFITKTGYVPKLAQNDTINLATSGLMSPSHISEASFVGEGGAKAAGEFGLRSYPNNDAKLVLQNRMSRELMKYDFETHGGYILEQITKGQAKSISRGIDTLVTHGTSPRTGDLANTINNNKVNDWIVNNATTEIIVNSDDPQEVDRALRNAIEQVDEGDFSEATGIALSNSVFYNLAGWETEFGIQRVPGLGYGRQDEGTFRGIQVAKTGRLGRNAGGSAGSDTGIIAIVGDFSKLSLGLDYQSVEVLEDGNPDGAKTDGEPRDLRHHNEFIVRTELFLKWRIENPQESFVVIRTAPEENGGED